MARMGSFSSDLKKLQKQLEQAAQQEDAFVESCAKELAARLLAKVKQRTPVGEYSGGEYICKARKGPKLKHISVEVEGKKGGTLRRGWTVGKIQKEGDVYKVEVINPVEYSSYVEFGHRQKAGRYVPALGKKLVNGWVQGHFMMTISEQEIRDIAPQVLEAKVAKFLRECMK
ncbi:MAG: HK97 gp10 family phage protein [Lachnospiraceae bacterium]|nr:HK97 gp10 family phage protein [Lachnospiraceae bacterium]